MKSYFLEGLTDYDTARRALSDRLPHWVEPWLLNDEAGDTVAFLTIEQSEGGTTAIQADLSGRHFDEAHKVIELLRSLQITLGGQVSDDNENAL